MLSAISSPHLSQTRLDASGGLPGLRILSQVAAVVPEEGSIMGPSLSRDLDAAIPTYRVRTPFRLEPHSEMDVNVTVISESASACVCQCKATGPLECFCRPLLEHLQEDAYIAKLFIQTRDEGVGRIVLEISTMAPVAVVVLDILVTHDLHVSQLAASDYRPGASLRVSLPDPEPPSRRDRPDFVPTHIPAIQSGSSPEVSLPRSTDYTDTDVRPRPLSGGRGHDMRASGSVFSRSLRSSTSRPRYIRVLPSDCLFGPSQGYQDRTIRIRNVFTAPLRIRCHISSRSFAADVIHKYPELSVGHAAYTLITPAEYLVPCTNDRDHNFIEAVVRYRPDCPGARLLHAAKLIISVEDDAYPGEPKAFQVPLLGLGGYPDVSVQNLSRDVTRRLLFGRADSLSFDLFNNGTAPAFIKLSILSALKQSSEGFTASVVSPFTLHPDAGVLQPGQRQQFTLRVRPHAHLSPTTMDYAIEVCFGHEGVRLLASAYDGQGPWTALLRQLQLREDPLRLMAETLERVEVPLLVS